MPRKRALCSMLLLSIALGFTIGTPEGDPHAYRGRYLVTGGAGFIGFHVARALTRSSSHLVVVMDNFNDYYDVILKIDRAYELYKAGVKLYKNDLCNANFLHGLIEKYNFTHVIHLAAQAGVRYSLQNPWTYVHTNIECHMTLMEVIRKVKGLKLVYASTSSIYGRRSPVPFGPGAHVDDPGNMYAATKRADEVMTAYYCERYGLSAVGLRFFTVYGPWGRPDMAVYKFTEAIMNDTPVPIFTTGNTSEPLGRDFTYIDDIVEGVLQALVYTPTSCQEVYNLGLGSPVSLPRMLGLLEQNIGKKALVNALPLPSTELLQTWADTQDSSTKLGFNPKISLDTGLKLFVDWFRKYRRDRQLRSVTNLTGEGWLASLVDGVPGVEIRGDIPSN